MSGKGFLIMVLFLGAVFLEARGQSEYIHYYCCLVIKSAELNF